MGGGEGGGGMAAEGGVSNALKKKKGEGKGPEKEEDDEKMDKLATEFEDIFKGIGKYRGEPVKIQLTDNVLPIIQPPRRIPLHYVQPLKDHLEEMIKEIGRASCRERV